MRVVVAMPAYNEAKGVGDFMNEVASAMSPHDVIFVVADDCSTDDTLDVLTELSSLLQLVIKPGERNMGHGPTTLRALKASLARQPDAVVAVDGDGQFTGHDIRRLVDLLAALQLDLVEGVRTGRGDPLFRRATSWSTRTLIQLRIGRRPLDANTPLRVYRPQILRSLLAAVPDDAITPNMVIAALTRVSGFRMREVPVVSLPRRGGDPAGSTWRARRHSIPNARFVRFCARAARQWLTMPLQPVGE